MICEIYVSVMDMDAASHASRAKLHQLLQEEMGIYLLLNYELPTSSFCILVFHSCGK